MSDKIVNPWMAQKAGMDHIDKAHIALKIQELTKGTNKYLYEKDLEQKRNFQITAMLKKIHEYESDPARHVRFVILKHIKQLVNSKIQYIERERDLTRIWAHLDFDMFYVACELLEKQYNYYGRPELADKPCAVGGVNGVLCTANYVARKYGVRSAIPTFIAMQLCPDLILFEVNFQKYRKYSNIFRQILSEYDDNLESLGMDEAYIDLTDTLRDSTPEQIQIFVTNLRQRIYDATKLTVSCGIGANKLLCKMASQEKKPNSQFILNNDKQAILNFMKDKPIRKIFGIGPVHELYLKGIGIHTAQDILDKADHIYINFTEHTLDSFISDALGIARNHHESRERKSVSRSQTFRPISTDEQIHAKFNQLAASVSQDLEELQLLALTISVTCQTEKYQKKQKCKTVDFYFNKHPQILEYALLLFREIRPTHRIRLLGIKCSNLYKVQDFDKNTLQAYLKEVVKKKTVVDPDKFINRPAKVMHRPAGIMDCPICQKQIDCKGNYSLFNKHIDKCLQSGGESIEMPPNTTLIEKIPVKKTLVEKQAPKKETKPAKNNAKKNNGQMALDRMFNK